MLSGLATGEREVKFREGSTTLVGAGSFAFAVSGDGDAGENLGREISSSICVCDSSTIT